MAVGDGRYDIDSTKADRTGLSVAVAVLGVLVVMVLVGVIVWLLFLTPVTYEWSGGISG